MKIYRASNLHVVGTLITVEVEGEGTVTADLRDWPKIIELIGGTDCVEEAILLPPDSIQLPGNVHIGVDDIIMLATARDAYLAGQLKPKLETSMKASILVTPVRVVGPFVVEVGFENGGVHLADFRQMPLEGVFRRAQSDIDFANSAALDCGDLAFEYGKWTLNSDFLQKHSRQCLENKSRPPS